MWFKWSISYWIREYIDFSYIFYDSKHVHSFLMKKKGQYSYSYHVNKLCENLKEEPSSYNTKSFHGSSDFVVLAWRQFGITIMQKRCMLYLFLVFWAKGRVATNSLTTLPSLNKKIYSFITFQKLSSASNFTIFCTSSKELSKF